MLPSKVAMLLKFVISSDCAQFSRVQTNFALKQRLKGDAPSLVLGKYYILHVKVHHTKLYCMPADAGLF